MMLYLSSNIRPDISFSVHQFARFTHNTKASHNMAVNMIFWYLQGTKYNSLVFNPLKKMAVDCYADAYFAGLWIHENPLDPIFSRRGTGFVVTLPIILYCGCQNYIHILLFVHNIMSIWHFLIMLDHYIP